MVINKTNKLATDSITPTGDSKARARNLLKDKNEAILDAIEDILEVKYLIEEIEKEENSVDQNDQTSPYSFSSPWCSLNIEQALVNLKAKVKRNLDTIERVARFSNQKDLMPIMASLREDHLNIKTNLREGFKLKGTHLVARDWQSPIYAASMPLTGNRLNNKIEEHVWDYKRDGHLDALAYEECFVREYLAQTGSKRLRSYLTNSGMAAFSTALHWLRDELNLSSKATIITPSYFENLHLAEAFFDKVTTIKYVDAQSLFAELNENKPQIVIMDAVTNCGTVQLQDCEAVLSWAKHDSKQETAIIIDTTCMPSMTFKKGLLEDLPEHVTVIIVESLAKHHQLGMDTVTGGIVVIDAEENLHKSFKPTRARLGTNISDASVGCLPAPNKQRLEQRLKRHSRNIDRVAQRLLAQIEDQSGIIDSISWVDKGPEHMSWFRSSIMSINLCPQFQSVFHYQEFENKLYELACEKQLPIAFSTSFGFDITRLYVTAPSTAYEPPFLRISPGTENLFQVEALTDILSIASEQLAASWTLRGKLVPVTKRPIRLPETAKTPKDRHTLDATIQDGVFAGENSLKEYLNPQNYTPTPLVELPNDLNPFKSDGVSIFAKFMPLVPLMNIKSIPAYSMLSNASERGELDRVKRIIESSSSNTVMSLSVIAKLFGVDTTCAIVDHSLNPGLEKMLRLFGIELFHHPSLGHELFGKVKPRRDRAIAMGAQEGWYNPNQYENPDNPKGFAKWLAPQLLRQTNGKIDILSLGLGTCGTMVGLSYDLRKENNELEIVACCPAPGQAVPGPREESLLQDVSFDWKKAYDTRLDLLETESFQASTQLLRRGIMAGPSSGMNYAGLLKRLERLKETGALSTLTKSRPDKKINALFLCCDSPLQHIDEYFKVLDSSYFPPVHPVKEEEL